MTNDKRITSIVITIIIIVIIIRMIIITRTVLIVVGVLGATSIRFNNFLGLLKIDTSMETIKKSAVLGIAHILRKVLTV